MGRLTAHVALSVSIALIAGFGAAESAARQSSPIPADLAEAACRLPARYLERIVRGYRPDRSGEIIVVPAEPSFLGSLPHSGPWDYLQRVPMWWYGPGHIRPGVDEARPVTLADIAPTQAELLGFPFASADGTPMSEAIVAGAEPPRLIVTLVWDGGGRNVLEQWPDSWPRLQRLIPQGAWFDNATVGSSPSITPPAHATIGTGVFPATHGQLDSELRIGHLVTKSGQAGPAYLNAGTLADVYDRSMHNEPVVGIVATVPWHVNMLGHGSMWTGGDRDLAVLRTSSESEGAEGDSWNVQSQVEPYFRFPAYVNDLPGLESYLRRFDRRDGALDGTWDGTPFDQLGGGFNTPARVPFQTRVVEEVIDREGFGSDAVPDLLFLNYKVIDHVGHVFSTNGSEMADTVRAQDADISAMIDLLDRLVGEGGWVLVLTADHGHQYDPADSGGFALSAGQLATALRARFDTDGDDVQAIEAVHTSQIFLDEEELLEQGHDAVDVSRFILGFTEADGAALQASPAPGIDAGEPVFSTALPSGMLTELSCG